VTENTKHFERFPPLKGKLASAAELPKKLKAKLP